MRRTTVWCCRSVGKLFYDTNGWSRISLVNHHGTAPDYLYTTLVDPIDSPSLPWHFWVTCFNIQLVVQWIPSTEMEPFFRMWCRFSNFQGAILLATSCYSSKKRWFSLKLHGAKQSTNQSPANKGRPLGFNHLGGREADLHWVRSHLLDPKKLNPISQEMAKKQLSTQNCGTLKEGWARRKLINMSCFFLVVCLHDTPRIIWGTFSKNDYVWGSWCVLCRIVL